ncbi:MAG: hypothetical protein WBX25_31640 [Rhodomicrobium sp.]
MNDLTRPVVASKEILEALEAIGDSKGMDAPAGIAELSRNSPYYGVSSIRALEIIQAPPPTWPELCAAATKVRLFAFCRSRFHHVPGGCKRDFGLSIQP